MKNLQGWMILGIACLAGCVGTTIPVQAQQTATAIVVKERLVAVSYTHLDVYKRQPCFMLCPGSLPSV